MDGTLDGTADGAPDGTAATPRSEPPGPAADGWSEGQDGRHPTYQEWLLPPWWAWLVSVALTGFLGVAFGAPYGARTGWLVFAGLQVAVVAVLLASAPRLRVDERVLRAGRARLPRRYVGAVRVLEPAAARELRGVQADPRAHLLLRTWTTGRALQVTVTDPQDPHPYWLVSTRHPADLGAALRGGIPGGSDRTAAAPTGQSRPAPAAADAAPGAADAGPHAPRTGRDS